LASAAPVKQNSEKCKKNFEKAFSKSKSTLSTHPIAE
jgi:hypothetical protein